MKLFDHLSAFCNSGLTMTSWFLSFKLPTFVVTQNRDNGNLFVSLTASSSNPSKRDQWTGLALSLLVKLSKIKLSRKKISLSSPASMLMIPCAWYPFKPAPQCSAPKAMRCLTRLTTTALLASTGFKTLIDTQTYSVFCYRTRMIVLFAQKTLLLLLRDISWIVAMIDSMQGYVDNLLD